MARKSCHASAAVSRFDESHTPANPNTNHLTPGAAATGAARALMAGAVIQAASHRRRPQIQKRDSVCDGLMSLEKSRLTD
jgi:hypothetical protein